MSITCHLLTEFFYFSLWPETGKLKKKLKEGKLDDPQEVKAHFLQRQLALEPHYTVLLDGLKQREQRREDALYQDETRPEPWWVKISKQPEV